MIKKYEKQQFNESPETIKVKIWGVYIGNWEMYKCYTEKEANDLVHFLKDKPYASTGRAYLDLEPKFKIKPDTTYIYGEEDFDKINKAVGGKLTKV